MFLRFLQGNASLYFSAHTVAVEAFSHDVSGEKTFQLLLIAEGRLYRFSYFLGSAYEQRLVLLKGVFPSKTFMAYLQHIHILWRWVMPLYSGGIGYNVTLFAAELWFCLLQLSNVSVLIYLCWCLDPLASGCTNLTLSAQECSCAYMWLALISTGPDFQSYTHFMFYLLHWICKRNIKWWFFSFTLKPVLYLIRYSCSSLLQVVMVGMTSRDSLTNAADFHIFSSCHTRYLVQKKLLHITLKENVFVCF